jgi:hypothetical protein
MMGDPNENSSNQLYLQAYLPAGLPAATWTMVSVPMLDLVNGSTIDSKQVSNIFFIAHGPSADGVYPSNPSFTAREIYFDDVVFTGTANVGIKDLRNSDFKVYYSNQTLNIPDYTGTVKVFNITGRLISEKQMRNGISSMQLNTGLYILNTTKGNVKLVVR